MTREEAIELLKEYAPRIKPFYEPYRTEYPQAIDMAIEALEMQNNYIICPRCGREFSEYEGRKQTNDK